MPKYRNNFEKKVGAELGPTFAYEAIKLTYTITHTYTPDFIDHDAKRIVEAKGFWRATDRTKMLTVIRHYPDYQIEMVFQNPDMKISKKSSTSYSDWCSKHGIAWRKA